MVLALPWWILFFSLYWSMKLGLTPITISTGAGLGLVFLGANLISLALLGLEVKKGEESRK